MIYIDVPSTKKVISIIMIPIGSILFLSRYLSIYKRPLKNKPLFMMSYAFMFDAINKGLSKIYLIYTYSYNVTYL